MSTALPDEDELFGQIESELDPLPREELKPLSGYEQVTLSPLKAAVGTIQLLEKLEPASGI